MQPQLTTPTYALRTGMPVARAADETGWGQFNLALPDEGLIRRSGTIER
jgi:hypothetical protein